MITQDLRRQVAAGYSVDAALVAEAMLHGSTDGRDGADGLRLLGEWLLSAGVDTRREPGDRRGEHLTPES